MKIEHLALWTNDLPRLRDFYVTVFGCRATALYHNPKKQFTSCFLSFDDGARLEIMTKPGLTAVSGAPVGLAHFAISVGSEQAVTELTRKLEAAGIPVASQPRRTGDGYFESVILDPDGNQVELTV